MKIFNLIGKAFYNLKHMPNVVRAKYITSKNNNLKNISDVEVEAKEDLFDYADELDDLSMYEEQEETKKKRFNFSFRSFFSKKLDNKIISDSDFDLLVNSELNKESKTETETILSDDDNKVVNFNSKVKKESNDKIVSDEDFEKLSSIVESEKQTEEEIEQKDNINSIDIFDYVSVLLQNSNLTDNEKKSLYDKLDQIDSNDQAREELQEKLVEISKINSMNSKYNIVLAVVDGLIKKYDVTEENFMLRDMIYEYLSNTYMDSNRAEKIIASLDKITEEEQEKELIEVIKNSNSVKSEQRYKYIMEEMTRIINGEEKKEEKTTTISNSDVVNFESFDNNNVVVEKTETPVIKNVMVVEPKIEKSILKEEKIGSKSNKPKTKEEYYNEYKNGKISASELVNACEKIEKEEQIKHEEKCKKDYELYQSRMNEIISLNSRLESLKQEVTRLGAGTIGSNYADILSQRSVYLKEIKELESMIDALSTRIVVLEKRGYAKEYELKHENDYVSFWEEELDKKEKEEASKNSVNFELFELFSDEELMTMSKNGFYSEPEKIDAVLEFKKMMKM